MKKKIAVILSAIGLLLPQSQALFAQGEATVIFLLITPGARATGMGNSFVSIADDATATYWNPAGMAFQTKSQVSLMHTNWLPQLASDLYYDYASVVHEIEGLGTIGGSITFINLGSQTITNEQAQELGTFSSNEWSAGLSFGTKLTENQAVGLQLKFIQSRLAPQLSNTAQQGDGIANAMAFDVSYLYKDLLTEGLNFGVNLTNIGPKVTYVDKAQADPLPTNLRLGFSYKAIDQPYNKLTFAVEFDKMVISRYTVDKATPDTVITETVSDPVYKALFNSWNDEPFSTEMKRVISNLGAEYLYGDMIAMRAGYHHDEIGRVKYLTFGAGLIYNNLNIDAAYISPLEKGHPLEDTLQFSFAFNF
jgi:hypothetical protein